MAGTTRIQIQRPKPLDHATSGSSGPPCLYVVLMHLVYAVYLDHLVQLVPLNSLVLLVSVVLILLVVNFVEFSHLVCQV